jgi:hypothetical protein
VTGEKKLSERRGQLGNGEAVVAGCQTDRRHQPRALPAIGGYLRRSSRSKQLLLGAGHAPHCIQTRLWRRGVRKVC